MIANYWTNVRSSQTANVTEVSISGIAATDGALRVRRHDATCPSNPKVVISNRGTSNEPSSIPAAAAANNLLYNLSRLR